MSTLRTEIDTRGVARLILARPEKRNALSSELIGALDRAAQELDANDTVRVVVLEAEGAVFCAGGDLNWMREQMDASAETRRAEARSLAMMLKSLNDLSKPLICRVQGDAFGGGLGLMSVSDIVIAQEGARFGLTETRLGLIPATIGPYVVARMGSGAARRVFYSARIFDCQDAVSLGLVSRCVTLSALDDAVAEEVSAYLATAPGAVSEAKALVARLGGRVDEAMIDASIDALVARWASPEAEEGTRAFFEKRAPSWAVD